MDVLEAVEMVKLKRRKEQRKIRVILIEDKKRNKIFYSVMDKTRVPVLLYPSEYRTDRLSDANIVDIACYLT